MVAAVSAAAPAAPDLLQDAGQRAVAQGRDAGGPVSSSLGDGGGSPLSAADREVVDNLELLEHLSEADLLDVLLPVRDE